MTAITKTENITVASVEYFSDAIINDFVASRHGSACTAQTYRNACRRLVKFFAAQKISVPSPADIDSFFNTLRAENKSASTIKLYAAVTKLFFSFLQKRGIYRDIAAETTPLKIKKTQGHRRDALSNEQAQKLLAGIHGRDEKNLRDRAIVALCLQCGLRTCEIERANVSDLSDEGNYFLLQVQGKGCTSKDNAVKVAPVVARMINDYLAARGEAIKDNHYSDECETPLFTSTARNSSKGRRLSSQSVSKMIKTHMRKIGINSKRLSAHSCRHYAATCAIQAVDIREVSAMLRHSSLNVTLNYLHDLSVQNRRAELSVADSLFGSAA